MMQNVMKAFDDYPSDKLLEDVWASYYNNMRSIMKELGGDDYINKLITVAKRESVIHIGASVDLSIST